MFRWADRFYNPYDLAKRPIKEVRKEYTRLRNIMRRSLTALRRAGYRNSEYVRRASRLGRTSQRHLSDEDVYSQLSDIHRELIKPWSTPEGMREHRQRTIEGLHEYGYDFVNEENLDDFEMFMEEFKGVAQALNYDSYRVAEMYDLLRERNISNRIFRNSFEEYMRGANELARTKPGRRTGYYSRIIKAAALQEEDS